MLVKATDKYEELNLKDRELDRIPKAGEKFEISEERYEVLTKTNKYNVAFVEKVKETEEIKSISKETIAKKQERRNKNDNEVVRKMSKTNTSTK